MVIRATFCAVLAGLSACSEPSPASFDAAVPEPAFDASVKSDAGADAAAPTFRIATLNLRCLVDDWDLRLPIIVAELAALRPDVIALQEVCRQEDGIDALPALLSRLEEASGATYESLRAETHLAWDTYHEGIALLSAHGFSQVDSLALPAGVFPRKAVIGSVTYEGISVLVGVTHLSFGDQAGVRAAQLGALRDAMAVQQVPGQSLVIAGDMNEGPEGGAIVASVNAGYVDAWAHMHPEDEGLTFPSNSLASRIDFLLVSSPGAELAVGSVNRFLTEPSGGVFASDHVGVWAELQ